MMIIDPFMKFGDVNFCNESWFALRLAQITVPCATFAKTGMSLLFLLFDAFCYSC